MKNTLGKVLILLSVCINLIAQTNLVKYELSSNKNELFVKEAVEIKFVAHQLNHEQIMYFFLEPKKSKMYKLVLLNKEALELAHHDKITTFKFLLFPLKSGIIKVDFNFTLKVASDEAVAQVFQGGRNNVQWIDTTNTKINLKPLLLNVKELSQEVDLVGDYNITSTLDKDSINSYDNANVTYNINGIGFDTFTINPIQKIQNVKIFSSINDTINKATSNGYKIHRKLKYALVSKNNFKIEKKIFKCYSPKNKTFYTISTKEFKIKVTPIKKSSLVDKENYPNSNQSRYDIKKIFIFIIIFLSGFITAKYLPSSFSKKDKPYQDIRTANDAKTLLFILMHRYDKNRLQTHYELLYDIVYNKNSSNNFKKIKKDILKALD